MSSIKTLVIQLPGVTKRLQALVATADQDVPVTQTNIRRMITTINVILNSLFNLYYDHQVTPDAVKILLDVDPDVLKFATAIVINARENVKEWPVEEILLLNRFGDIKLTYKT